MPQPACENIAASNNFITNRSIAYQRAIIYRIATMKATKKERQLVFDKYEGRCAYCGCILTKGWHIDHLKPIRRKKYKKGECRYPQREIVDNYMPACASCNINKHAMKLEDFRQLVAGFMKHLNERNTQYKIAKRYGLVVEHEKPVIFYFEQYEKENEMIAV